MWNRIPEQFRRQLDPSEGTVPFSEEDEPSDATPVRLGVGLREIDETVLKQFELPAGTQGVVVMTVEPDSFADRAGAEPGDILVSLNQKPVKNVADVRTLMAGVSRGDRLEITLRRMEDGTLTTITQTMRIR
jgi:serine protease Do